MRSDAEDDDHIDVRKGTSLESVNRKVKFGIRWKQKRHAEQCQQPIAEIKRSLKISAAAAEPKSDTSSLFNNGRDLPIVFRSAHRHHH